MKEGVNINLNFSKKENIEKAYRGLYHKYSKACAKKARRNTRKINVLYRDYEQLHEFVIRFELLTENEASLIRIQVREEIANMNKTKKIWN